MAFYNFTGANGDPLPAGLTAQNGTFEIQSNRLQASSPDPLGPKWVCTQESTADATISCIFNGNGDGSNDTTGICFRYSDNDNLWMAVLRGNGEAVLFKRVAGSFTNLGSYTVPGFGNSADQSLEVVLSGSSVTFNVNGAEAVAVTDSFNSTATQHGLRFGNTVHSMDDLTVPDAAAVDSITVAEATFSNIVYQRTSSDIASVSFGVTYSGTPTALEYRLLDATDDTTEIATWATFDASPSGGTSTLTFNAPASTTPYHVEVRFTNDTGVSDLQSTDWRVGDNVLIFGQSLAEDLNTNGAVTPDSAYYVWNGSQGAAPTVGVGANALANAIIGAENVSVMVINTGVGGTALTAASGDASYWNDATGTLWTDTTAAISAATDGSNRIAFSWWHQGTRDSLAGVTETQYNTALGEFFTRVRGAFTDKDGGTLPILTALLGRDTRGTATDASHQAIRDAQISYVATDSDAHPLTIYPTPNTDGVHATDAGYIDVGQKIATLYYIVKGDVVASAPAASSISQGDTVNDIDITFDANLLSADTTYSTEGVRVEDDGAPLTVTGFSRKNANTATVTVSETPAGTINVWLGYGVGATSNALTYPRSEDIALPSAGGTYNLTSLSFSEQQLTISSTLNISVTGVPDGTYRTVLVDDSSNVLSSASLTYASGAASVILQVAAGTNVEGYVIDNESPHVDGAVITGTTA